MFRGQLLGLFGKEECKTSPGWEVGTQVLEGKSWSREWQELEGGVALRMAGLNQP